MISKRIYYPPHQVHFGLRTVKSIFRLLVIRPYLSTNEPPLPMPLQPPVVSMFCTRRSFFLPRHLTSSLLRSPLKASLPPVYFSARMASTLPKLPLFEAISSHDPKSTSVIHSVSGRRFTYGQLLHDVAERRDSLSNEAGPKGLEGERIAFLVENSYDYVGAQPRISVCQKNLN